MFCAEDFADDQFNRLRFGGPPLESRFPMSKKSPKVTRRFEPAPAPRERIDVEERVLCRLECEVCRLGFRGRGCGWGMTSTRTDGVDAGGGIEWVSGAGVGGVSRGALLSMSMGYWCAERNVNASERGWSRVCC